MPSKVKVERIPRLQMHRVGVEYPDYCDQQQLRDRDSWILAESGSLAVKGWMELHKNWIRDDEKEFVRVLEVMIIDGVVTEEEVTYPHANSLVPVEVVGNKEILLMKSTGENRFIVLCRHHTRNNYFQYVTWEYNPEGKSFYWGHYFDWSTFGDDGRGQQGCFERAYEDYLGRGDK